MIKIGDYNNLKVLRKTDFGYYLEADTERNSSDGILLPLKSIVGSQPDIGDTVEVFIYRDSQDRLIATEKRPIARVDEIAYLKVVSTTKIGSFIDFGLERDILVPMKERLYTLENEKYYLFYIYLDKTGRLAATTNIDKYLSTTKAYKIGDIVKGTVYGFQTNKSVMVAVDNLYKGVILSNEYFTHLNYGDVLELTVKKIYEDEKLGLTPRKPASLEVPELAERILEYLKNYNGYMKYNDKSSPEEIYEAFQVSKGHFKNSLGILMKRNLIEQNEKGTRLK